MPRLRIMLADDSASFRESLRAILELSPELEIVAQAGDGQEAIRQALEDRPAIVLLDVSMPHLDGLQACKAIKREAPNTGIILVTFCDLEQQQLLDCGADGYVQKGAGTTEVLRAICQARLKMLLDSTLSELPLAWRKALSWLVFQDKLGLAGLEAIAASCADQAFVSFVPLCQPHVSQEDVAAALAFATDLPLVALAPYSAGASTSEKVAPARKSKTRAAANISSARHVDPVQAEAAAIVPASLAKKWLLVPVAIVGDEVIVAMADPTDANAFAAVAEAAGRKIRPVLSTPSDIQAAIDRVLCH